MLVHLSLSQLHLSEKNVRKTHHEGAYHEMCASLLHHGLQQNLVVIEEAPHHYAVIAGGRRLRGMQDLHDQGKIIPNIGHDWLIPCQVAAAIDALERCAEYKPRLVRNNTSGRVAICISTRGHVNEQGELIPRVSLIRPLTQSSLNKSDFEESGWVELDYPSFAASWNEEVATAPNAPHLTILPDYRGIIACMEAVAIR